MTYPVVDTKVMYYFKCERCDTWSTRPAKPLSHRRFIRSRDGQPPADMHVIEVNEAGTWVECGPFATYEVRKVQQ